MADLFQGSQLPSTTTTTQTQQTAPEFYTNYLQDIANLGQNAVTQGGVAGPSALQQTAYGMAPQAAFSGAGTLGDASQMLKTAGTTTAPSVVNQYMDPYLDKVVNEMARLSQQNVQRNVLPALKGYGASTGGFGSSRMANATGQTLADIAAGLTGQQYSALSQGYRDAINAAQSDLNRGVQAGSALTSTGAQQANVGQTGLKTLADLGATQQQLEQARLNYPMQQAQEFAKLLQPYAGSIPVGTTQQTTSPGQQGQFANSPLAQIAGLLTGIGSLMSGWNTGANTGAGTNTGTTSGSSDSNWLTDLLKQFGISFAEGGMVSNANVKGGLQSIIQHDDSSNTNPNVPMAYSSNSNVPMLSQTLPPMNPPKLNYAVNTPDYREVG